MESTAIARAAEPDAREPQLALLLADDEPSLRLLLAAHASRAVMGLRVLEAEDGAQAVQIGLQQRPALALLDVQMPRLGGLEAAVTLRELEPCMRLALYTAEPQAHRDWAREHRLPLFDKLDLGRPIRWLQLQAQALHVPQRNETWAEKRSFECSVCGYGAFREAPPERCPMCLGEGTWIHKRWRAFGRPRVLAG